VAGSAANLVYEVAPLIKQSVLERAARKAGSAAKGVKEAALAAPLAAQKAVSFARDPETHERLAQDFALARELLSGKARERLIPLAQHFLGKAVFENNPEVRGVAYEPIAAE
jgi:hypothetical protein